MPKRDDTSEMEERIARRRMKRPAREASSSRGGRSRKRAEDDATDKRTGRPLHENLPKRRDHAQRGRQRSIPPRF